jgi:3-oxoacyl-[acyl-carrier protein] reductase
VDAVTNEIVQSWGRLDALICNAGVTADGSLALMSDDDWQRVLEVNLKGAFHCSRAALRPMLAQRDGHIIFISSFSGRVGTRGQTNYAAAKAGLIGLSQSLAREAGPRNVRANAVLPGVLPTPMTGGLEAATLASFVSANTLGRINTLDEVARFIAFLTATQNISGQIFQLDSRVAPWT